MVEACYLTFTIPQPDRLGTGDTAEKEDAISATVDVVKLYPPNTRVFINTWTWGCVFLSLDSQDL